MNREMVLQFCNPSSRSAMFQIVAKSGLLARPCFNMHTNCHSSKAHDYYDTKLSMGHFVIGCFLREHFVKGCFLKGHFVKGCFLRGHFVKGCFLKGHFVKG